MALKIRLQRGGATHAPHYRVVVAEAAARRDGRFVEKVGTYDPKNKVKEKQESLNLERIEYWIGVGAKPTDTVRSMIKRARREAKNAPVEEAAPAAAEA
jgi:small subunit ribosomal protein S16